MAGSELLENGAQDAPAIWCSISSNANIVTIVGKWELSQMEKLLIFQSIHVPTVTYGQDLWVMTKGTRSWIQVVDLSFHRCSFWVPPFGGVSGPRQT